jgi:hypothetical protein
MAKHFLKEFVYNKKSITINEQVYRDWYKEHMYVIGNAFLDSKFRDFYNSSGGSPQMFAFKKIARCESS